MARMPGVIWRPITVNKSRWRLVPLRVNLHVAVSEERSLFGYFNQARSRPDSHFYVRRDGTIEQYVDTALVAYADLEGNGSTISVETQGGLTATQTEPWTAAQVESLARIYAWAIKTHGIAQRIADDSRPGDTSRGLSWHRLGCDGNFPGRPLHGRVAGGRKYSKAYGKVCPGDAKIRQIPDIYQRATGATTERTWLDMVSMQEFNTEASRHAENVVAQVTENLLTALPDMIDERIRVRIGGQNTALHLMTRRELAAALADIDLDLDPAEVAAKVAAVLGDDLAAAVTEALAERPDQTADEIADAVVGKIATRLTQED